VSRLVNKAPEINYHILCQNAGYGDLIAVCTESLDLIVVKMIARVEAEFSFLLNVFRIIIKSVVCSE